jgi:hypothetical protein
MGEDGARMFEWFDRTGYSADTDALRREHPEVGWHTFEDWTRAQNWSALGHDAASSQRGCLDAVR